MTAAAPGSVAVRKQQGVAFLSILSAAVLP